MRRGVPDYIEVTTVRSSPRRVFGNGWKLRDELLDREVFDTLLEAKVLIERWRRAHNSVRPHSSLDYRAPAPGMLATPTLLKQWFYTWVQISNFRLVSSLHGSQAC